MKGQILDFSISENSGLISGEDGKRYKFVGASWKESTPPTRGLLVDFDTDGQQIATDIFLALPEEKDLENKKYSADIFCAVIALFVGIVSILGALTLADGEYFSDDEIFGSILIAALAVGLGITTLVNEYQGTKMAITAIILGSISGLIFLGF